MKGLLFYTVRQKLTIFNIYFADSKSRTVFKRVTVQTLRSVCSKIMGVDICLPVVRLKLRPSVTS